MEGEAEGGDKGKVVARTCDAFFLFCVWQDGTDTGKRLLGGGVCGIYIDVVAVVFFRSCESLFISHLSRAKRWERENKRLTFG